METLLMSLSKAADALTKYLESKARHHDAMAESCLAYKNGTGAPPPLPVATPAPKKESEKRPGAPTPASKPESGSQSTGHAIPPEPPAASKRAPGRPKKTPPAPAAVPQDLLPIDPEYAALTDAESAKRIFEVGERLIEAYPDLGAAGPDGEPAPEGFHMVVAALKDKFGVERLAKLTHTQRLQFMSLMKAKLPAAPAASTPAGDDPNAGI